MPSPSETPASTRHQSQSRFLSRHFRPDGVRLGILLLAESDPATVDVAAQVLLDHGLLPARRLARLHPRIGAEAVTSAELVGFLRRYGHEYGAAWLPLDTADGVSLDRAAVEAAGRTSGCAVGWYDG